MAVDIGASSGRHILGSYQNGKLVLEEIHRFENNIRVIDEHLSWDVDYLFHEIIAGMIKYHLVWQLILGKLIISF